MLLRALPFKLLSLSFMLLNPLLVTADSCTCIWQGSFAKAAQRADLIVTGSIISHKGNAADLQIQRVIQGKEFQETIRLWGEYKQECRPSMGDFPVNSQWMFALHRIEKTVPSGFNPNTPNVSYGRVNDYYVSQCGVYWLSLHDGYVSGNLINGPRRQWKDEKMNPVLVELVGAYLQGIIPDTALIEAAKPQTASKKLMEETKQFLQEQY